MQTSGDKIIIERLLVASYYPVIAVTPWAMMCHVPSGHCNHMQIAYGNLLMYVAGEFQSKSIMFPSESERREPTCAQTQNCLGGQNLCTLIIYGHK